MTISRVNAIGWGVGEKLTSAQQNALDINVTNAADKRSGQTDTVGTVWTMSGAGRLIDTSQVGFNGNINYTAGGGNRIIRVDSTITANRIYTLDTSGVQDGDRIGIYCEPSFNFTITVKNQAAVTLFELGNNADGTWAELIYKGSSWRLYQYSKQLTANPAENGFRLCGFTGLPADGVVLTTTVYMSPFTSNKIALYDTAALRWRVQATSEVALPLGTVTSGKNYDVFAYWTGSAVALEFSAAWTTNTARADAVTTQDGVLVKNADKSRRLIGTIRTVSTTQTADHEKQRFIWNASNKLRRSLIVTENTYSWTYVNPGGTFRNVRGQSSNRVEYVCGAPSGFTGYGDLELTASGLASCPVTSQAFTAIDHDIVGDFSQISRGVAQPALTVQEGSIGHPLYSRLIGTPLLGYHAVDWIETGQSGSQTYTFYGNTYLQAAGMTGTIMM